MQPKTMIWIGIAGLITAAVGGLALIPSPRGAGPAARASQSEDYLHNMVVGLLDYEGAAGSLLPSTSVSDAAPAVDLHGWQTHLLPFIEQKPLYSAIDLNRPWDDAANLPHFSHGINLYESPGRVGPAKGPTGLALTDYSGNSQVLTRATPLKLKEVTDGAANTIVMGEISTNLPPWGQPRNVRNPADGLHTSPNSFGGPWKNGMTQFGLLDGKVRAVNRDIDPKVLKALATPAGGETPPQQY